ncbi:hypothetical protein EDEG_00419 [Edhazardia aedis USNM 41457]|uniref:Uncharacterized protein n=1 Tax=Edhazardia aedis (strain USNM 41457) TaxID=1003232 RepID=J9DJQ5_EDHAE|nr:hypothetical protein EDEG_00419 [Edhazardia aedis USNM 41457]|eukprot:EJW01567.1 hypothetical protein EDEG_00419 [Edhazardia aedis USNM 41457]
MKNLTTFIKIYKIYIKLTFKKMFIKSLEHTFIFLKYKLCDNNTSKIRFPFILKKMEKCNHFSTQENTYATLCKYLIKYCGAKKECPESIFCAECSEKSLLFVCLKCEDIFCITCLSKHFERCDSAVYFSFDCRLLFCAICKHFLVGKVGFFLNLLDFNENCATNTSDIKSISNSNNINNEKSNNINKDKSNKINNDKINKINNDKSNKIINDNSNNINNDKSNNIINDKSNNINKDMSENSRSLSVKCDADCIKLNSEKSTINSIHKKTAEFANTKLLEENQNVKTEEKKLDFSVSNKEHASLSNTVSLNVCELLSRDLEIYAANEKNIRILPCRIIRGCANLGNTGYLNCIVQMFLNDVNVRAYFFNKLHDKSVCQIKWSRKKEFDRKITEDSKIENLGVLYADKIDFQAEMGSDLFKADESSIGKSRNGNENKSKCISSVIGNFPADQSARFLSENENLIFDKQNSILGDAIIDSNYEKLLKDSIDKKNDMEDTKKYFCVPNEIIENSRISNVDADNKEKNNSDVNLKNTNIARPNETNTHNLKEKINLVDIPNSATFTNISIDQKTKNTSFNAIKTKTPDFTQKKTDEKRIKENLCMHCAFYDVINDYYSHSSSMLLNIFLYKLCRNDFFFIGGEQKNVSLSFIKILYLLHCSYDDISDDTDVFGLEPVPKRFAPCCDKKNTVDNDILQNDNVYFQSNDVVKDSIVNITKSKNVKITDDLKQVPDKINIDESINSTFNPNDTIKNTENNISDMDINLIGQESILSTQKDPKKLTFDSQNVPKSNTEIDTSKNKLKSVDGNNITDNTLEKCDFSIIKNPSNVNFTDDNTPNNILEVKIFESLTEEKNLKEKINNISPKKYDTPEEQKILEDQKYTDCKCLAHTLFISSHIETTKCNNCNFTQSKAKNQLLYTIKNSQKNSVINIQSELNNSTKFNYNITCTKCATQCFHSVLIQHTHLPLFLTFSVLDCCEVFERTVLNKDNVTVNNSCYKLYAVVECVRSLDGENFVLKLCFDSELVLYDNENVEVLDFGTFVNPVFVVYKKV